MEPRPQHLQTRSTLTGLVDEACRRKFEAAWLSSQPQPIEAFLPSDEAPDYLGTLEELVHIELEFSWKFRQGLPGGAAPPFRKPPRVEDYLNRFPRLRLPSTARRIVEQEYRVRRSFAQHPSAKEYHSRFPELYPDEASAKSIESPPEPGALPQFPGYSLERELGRGGMGIVYEALQIDLKRPVALKVMRAGNHAAEDEIARFHTEAETVARLQHPNIVEIYEIGSADGNPYLTLEFVDGGTLADTIASRPQPPRDAADRVRQLAAAAECAHQSGVIHRDLKPSNVLLTASGIPKISDFGLARQMEAETPHTRTGEVLGTPSYMAPEQAEGRPRDIGPATDVYALGAILYELLTGRPPFLAETPIATLQQVLEVEPISPSRLQPGVPRDLATISLKALEKEPARRYPSAAELGADLERFLAGKPIQARPASLGLRTWKWIRRHPGAATVLAVTTLAVASLLLGALWYQGRLEKSLERETAQKTAAQESFQQARQAVDQMLTRVAAGPLANVPQMEGVTQQLLEDALVFYRGFLEERGEDPEVRREAARAFRRVGDIRFRLGQPQKARESFRNSTSILEQLTREHPGRRELWHDLADTHNNQAQLLAATGQEEKSVAALREAVRLREDLVGRASALPSDAFKLAESYHGLGTFLLEEGQRAEAEVTLRLGRDTLLQLSTKLGDRADYLNQLARTLNNLGQLLRLSDRVEQAEESFRESVVLKERLVQMRPDEPDYRVDLGNSQNNLGILYWAQERDQEAEASYRRALELQESLAVDFPTVPDYQAAVGATLHNLAEIEMHRDNPQEAWGLLSRAIRHQLTALRFNAQSPLYRRHAYNHHWALAEVLLDLGKHSEAAQASEALLRFRPQGWVGLELTASNLAQCAGLTSADKTLDAAASAEFSQRYGDRALKLLQQAVAAGFSDAWKLVTANEYSAVRGRKDFQALTKDLAARKLGGGEK